MHEEISIALATYNGERFIQAQLQSLADQTHLPSELVVCDDGSNDATLSIIEAFAATAPFPVHVHRNTERLGYKQNFMEAASLCNSALISFCDQDDIWHRNKVASILSAFKQADVMIVYHNARLVGADGEYLGRDIRDTESHTNPVLGINPWWHPLGYTETFRREILALSHMRCSGQKFPDLWTAHDQWVYMLAISLGSSVYIGEPLVDYRQHGSNTYGWTTEPASRLSVVNRAISTLDRYGDYFVLADVSSKMAAVFDDGGRLLPPQFLGRAAEAAVWWRKLAKLYELQSHAYADHTVWSRFTAWLKLVEQGVYRSNRQVRFGRHGFVRDLLQGVLFARLKTEQAPPYDWNLELGVASASTP